MSLASGTKLAHYEILEPIGKGGMGEVYRANDSKLGRDVAIKVLPDEFAQDEERLRRFQREAKVLASLNHPNIASIYGLEHSEGTHYLVLELVPGETLADRIARGPIPLDEALEIARKIAEALEEAHEQGIVHRDLKPANIKLTLDDKVKVLDFGLAKAFVEDGAEGDAATSMSPTITRDATRMGVILGTAAYMSPEQAKGKRVDKRADIWAFGALLYEMLTGTRAFSGEDVSETLASVIKDSPDWNLLPAETPSVIRQLLHRCLNKDAKERLRDIGEARVRLGDELSGPSSSRPPQPRPSFGIVGMGIAIVVAVAAVAASIVYPRLGTEAEQPVIGFPISSTESLRIATGNTTPFAISPDGKTIVFQAVAPPATRPALWVRALHDPRPRALGGTDDGAQPAISPDGQWIAFVSDNRTIKKVSVDGGPVTTLATLEYNAAALSWLSVDEILTETLGPKGIQILNAQGSTPEVVIPLDTAASEFRQRRPFVLRDRKMVLYASTTGTGRTELAMFSLEDGRRARLGVEGIQVLGVVDDRLVYVRENGVLMSVPFDAGEMRTTGAPLQLLEQVASTRSGVAVALSETGTLVYEAPHNPNSHLTLVDRSGRILLLGPDSRNYAEPRFSPDATRIAVGVATGTSRNVTLSGGFDLWTYDGALTSPQRLTRSGNSSEYRWSPSGKEVIYPVAADDGTTGLWSLSVDGSTEPVRVDAAGDWVREAEITPDGKSLVIRRVDPHSENLAELVLMPLEGDSTPISLVKWPSWPFSFRLSPNGRLLAYVDRRPVDRVMVMTLDGETRVFVGDGGQPVFAPDSRSLFYRSGEQLMEAALTTSPTLAVVRQTVVIDNAGDVSFSDVTSDGRGFLALTPVERAGGSEILVSVNWAAEKVREWRNR